MDAAGLTLSLIDLCGRLYKICQTAKNAPEVVKKLVEELVALQLTLESVNHAIAKLQQHPSVLRKIEIEIASCLKDLEELYTEVNTSSKGLRGEIKGWWRKFKWPLKENETREYILQIDRLKTHLVIELQAHHMNIAKEEADRQEIEREQQRIEREAQDLEREKQDLEREKLEQQREKETRRLRDEKREKVLQWIHGGKSNQRHIHIQSRRKAGTGQWLLESVRFREWIESESSAVLLGCGIPGAGKTFLSSVVIDHLTDRRNESGGTDGVAYIYFGYQDQNQQKPIDVISIFIRQLLVQLQELPSDIESPFDMMAQNGSPNYDTLKGFIFSLSKRFSKQNGQAFIVCDALDEMDEHGQRQELLPLLHEMKNAGIKLFLTSRPHPADVRISFADSIQLELTPHTDDLKKYIAQKLAGNTCTYRLIEASRSLDMEDVISALVASAEGMFLVAHLNAMHICDQSTARDISKELQEIKSSERGEHLDRVYDRSVRTILSGRKGSVELALRVLSWLDNARRPLFANELVIAVSIDVDQKALDPDSLPVAEKLADVCAGLIIIEENSQTARFSHYTVQEYLRRKSVVPEHLKGAYHFSVCMTHLSFDEFKKGACISSKKIRSRFGENPFFAYVSRNVSFHLKACGEINTTDYVAGFVSDLGLVSSWRQAKECTTYRPEPGRVVGLRKWKSAWNKGIMDCTSPVSAACELGHQAYLRSLIETKGISAILETGERLSPLHIAAKNGNTGVARLLIDLGADISFLSGKYQQIRPLLHLATKRRHMETVLLLIEKGAVVTAADRKGYTPLTIASKQGYEELVRLFIHNGALITPVDGLRDNALHLAANHGHKDIVRLLIDKGAIAKKPDHYGRTPFHLAAKSGGIDTIRTLVDYGAGNFEPDDEGDTPLHYAVSYADESVIRFLISMTGADVLARNKKGITPVHNCATRARFGANRYDVSFIRMIIESGDIEKNISTTTDRGETLLHLLVKSDCNEDLVRFLVDKGADINARNTLGETPLQCTTWWHRNARLLIDLGADVKVDNKSGTRTLLGSALGNALYHARWVDKIMYGEGDPSNLVDLNAHISVSRQLIANGACISGADDKGLTPLHIAAGGGGHFAEIVEMILERGADVSATDNEGCTPLHAAASHRLDNSAIIALLVSHGAEISAIDSNGKMPLHHAGCYPVARAIIDRGACVSAADSQGLLPLHHAARSAYKEVARILIEKGANISATNEDGITPLHWQSATPYANRKCLSKRAGPGINEKYEDNKLLAGFLIENGANISAVDKFGRTPLHLAAKFGNEAVVRVYVQKRLDISPLDGTGRTALQIAMKYKRISIVRLLRSATQGENPDNSEVECEGYDSDYDTELKIHRYNYKARTKYHDDSDGQLGEEYNSDRPKDPEI